MDFFLSVARLANAQDWLVTANLVFSALLLLWILRYRVLYLTAERERKQYHDTIENLSEGFYRSTLDGRQISANRSLVRLNGYDSEEEMLTDVRDIAVEWYVDPKRRAEFARLLHRDGILVDFVSEVYRHKTRERIWVSENARLVRDNTGKALCYEGSVRDVTSTVERLELEERLEKLTRHVPGGLFQLVRHPGGQYTLPFISAGFRRIVTSADDELVDHPDRFIDFIHPSDMERFQETLTQSERHLRPWTAEFRIIGREAETVWLSLSATPQPGGDGSVTWHGYLADVSDRKRTEERIHQLAYFDPLTRLPNRRLLIDRLEQVIGSCARRAEHAALLFVDMDSFKSLNDTQGHEMGDRLLTEAAARLKRELRRNDTVARFGGDEFVIILEDLGLRVAEAQARAAMVARKAVESFREPFNLGKIEHTATLSIGVIVFDGQADRSDELLKSADIAMYEAKKNGRDGFQMFDPVSRQRVADSYTLQSDLRGACERGEMRLMFQPQVDARSRATGVEALLRWDHPVLGTVMPNSFIPLAEQSGLINMIDDWVLENATRKLAEWRSNRFLKDLVLSINVSAQHFRKQSFPDEVAAVIRRYGIDPSRLVLELTEHAMASDREELERRMTAIKALGVRFSLDDFGTGYSSLSFLKDLPLDEVKIDGSFVAGITSERADREFVRMILALARTLGLSTVAERVENSFQESFLVECGCERFQGFHYSGALSESDLEAFVRRSTDSTDRQLARTA